MAMQEFGGSWRKLFYAPSSKVAWIGDQPQQKETGSILQDILWKREKLIKAPSITCLTLVYTKKEQKQHLCRRTIPYSQSRLVARGKSILGKNINLMPSASEFWQFPELDILISELRLFSYNWDSFYSQKNFIIWEWLTSHESAQVFSLRQRRFLPLHNVKIVRDKNKFMFWSQFIWVMLVQHNGYTGKDKILVL